jgi:deoxyribodipyrimidine photolyase-related protein
MRAMVPAERELRVDLQKLADKGGLELLSHEGWLTSPAQFRASAKKGPPWRMDAFYRYVRRDTGILMHDNKPEGGKFSFDAENRLPWKGQPAAPDPPAFPRDPVKEEVGKLIQREFAHHPGCLDLDALPGTREDAETLWSWAKRECLPRFGPYEDAMSLKSSGLFHTRISALMNIHRLLPSRIISDALSMDLPLGSREGFIRQVLGWREFVNHVHCATDGFRNLPTNPPPMYPSPGDGGYDLWSEESWKSKRTPRNLDGGAAPSALGCERPLPPAYWGAKSGLGCLDHVVSAVWEDGYSHHITRLMILSNLATLLDVQPRELTDWFWVAYTDAYDWVVEPNVLGMGTFAVGELMITKPYVSGAAYINRMSDYCSVCAFNPQTNCPITPLYWDFLARHQKTLKDNPRLRMPYVSLKKRGKGRGGKDRATFHIVRDALMAAEPVTPKDMP